MATDLYAELALHSNKISGLADGEAPTEAVNRGQLDAVSASVPRIHVGFEPPEDPDLNDLWVDLSA